MADVKFPRLHIAESVINRILNLRDELATSAPKAQAVAAPPMPTDTPPAVPDPSLEGAQLEMELESPVADVAPPADMGIDPMRAMIGGTDLIEGV